ncbi:MAG TPA: hypothetical protein VML96_07465 [Egibacteraceae bacterium]|nr:hypothetical protein [Egibacteraceae bacterium]
MQRHRLDAVSLIPGLAFATLGLVFLYGNINLLRVDWSWIWPAAAILVGLALLLSLRPQPRREDEEADDRDREGDDGEPLAAR